jgi:methyltransferase family protein
MTAPLDRAPIGTELLDDPAADPSLVRESLRSIARSNRWFGGRSALRHGLGRLLGGVAPGTTVTLLDVGTGAGDLPLDAVRWAARRGIRLVPVGLERSRAAAVLSRDAGLPTFVACATRLPVRPRSVDLIVVSQVAHHLPGETVVRLARDFNQIARIGVVLADLRRSGLALAGFWLGSRLLRFDPATRADGLTSVRRGYARRELAALLGRAGIAPRVEARPGFRLVATWRTGEG